MTAKSNGEIFQELTRLRIELATQANSNRAELKNDILRLESKFDTLESGRLARLEERQSKSERAVSLFSYKLAALGFIGSSISGAIVTAVVFKIFGVR